VILKLSWLSSVLQKNSEIEWMLDLDLLDGHEPKAYIKKTALETCINIIARTISQAEFRYMQGNKKQLNEWHYLLNIRPNTDQSAADFWHSVVYKLIYDNEVLIIKTDKNELLIADSFDRTEYAVYPDLFKEVTVKDYTFNRTFNMDEVIHLNYNNEKLTAFLNGMFDDYAELFSRMLEVSKRNNQIRGMVEVNTTTDLKDETRVKLQSFIDKMFASFQNNLIALIPKTKGFEYTEISKGDSNGKSVEELAKLKQDLTNTVANILGIPISIVHGNMSEYETALKAYNKFCIQPLVKKIQDELNAKIVERKAFMVGDHIRIVGVSEKNALDVADAIDKLIASSAYTANEIREKLGDERSDDPNLDKHVITKNYQSVEGGDKNDEEDQK